MPKSLMGVIIKIDFEKACDKVKWSFLQQTLRMKGFCQQWCAWVENFVTRGSVGIKINDAIGHYFKTHKGLRQGDPMSPILFSIVAYMLFVLVKRAKDDDQIKGVIPHLVEDGLSILQYADDTILFIVDSVYSYQSSYGFASGQIPCRSQGTLLPSSGEPKVSNPWNNVQRKGSI
jgi:hypothetical protein